MKAKIRRQKLEDRSAMPDGVRSGGLGKSGKRFSGYTSDELAGFKSRNVEIAESAIRGGKKFSEVAKEYNLTRERVRQIVKLMNPEAYLKRREDRRNRKKTMQYDRCAECGRGKSRWGSTPSRKYCHVDPEHLYCGSCRKAKYQREITLVCRCGRKSKIMWGWLQYRKSRGEYKSARLSANGKTGTYVCPTCHKE